MKEQFFFFFLCAPADGVSVGDSVTLIHIAHMMVIIPHNLWLYGFFSLTAEITFRWGIVNITQHAYVSFVSPQYCRQVSPGSNVNVSPFQFCLRAFPVWPDSTTTVNLFRHQIIK
jgi:hypothetical protein